MILSIGVRYNSQRHRRADQGLTALLNTSLALLNVRGFTLSETPRALEEEGIGCDIYSRHIVISMMTGAHSLQVAHNIRPESDLHLFAFTPPVVSTKYGCSRRDGFLQTCGDDLLGCSVELGEFLLALTSGNYCCCCLHRYSATCKPISF